MLRDEYLRRLVDEAYVDIYVIGEGARIYWPWRLQPVHESTDKYRNACESYMIDSAFSKEDIDNVDVLDEAHRVDAEYAILADVYQDKDATIDALHEGLALAEEHPFDGKLIAPLQAPHDECYKEIEGLFDYVAVGGLKDEPPAKQIAATSSIRAVAGDDVKIHGLGFALSEEDGSPNQWIQEIQLQPGLIDSIDTTAYIQRCIRREYEVDKGEERRSVDCMELSYELVRDLRRVSSYAEIDSTHTQTTLH